MGMKDFFKKMVNLPDDDEYEEDYYDDEPSFFDEEEESEPKQTSTAKPKKETSSFFSSIKSGGSSKVVDMPSSAVQVVLVKPTRFEDAPSVADHLNARKTVVLNLEAANRETSRRLIDFLSGTAYATRGSIKKVANSTYIITPANVDVLGELIDGDFDTDGMFLG
ncbi:MAG: cell division protein SepF [Clostridia bacterium]|nr:cell division protein SepF [Clostridia bacterium]